MHPGGGGEPKYKKEISTEKEISTRLSETRNRINLQINTIRDGLAFEQNIKNPKLMVTYLSRRRIAIKYSPVPVLPHIEIYYICFFHTCWGISRLG